MGSEMCIRDRGMPVEVSIQTGERRAGDYFVEPLFSHLGRALREE